MTIRSQAFTEDRSAEAVAESFGAATDPRLREVLTQLVRHLHEFVKEVELTGAEWEAAVDFLTEVGHWSTGERQELILLSDVLGVSMLVETINNRSIGGATESTVLGPFHVVESPPREARRPDCAGRQGGAVPGDRSGPRPGWSPAGGRAGRCLAGQRRGLLRRAATRRAAGPQPARAVHRRRRRTVLVSHRGAALLSDPHRRPGRQRCSPRPVAIPTGRRTSTSSSPPRAIGR